MARANAGSASLPRRSASCEVCAPVSSAYAEPKMKEASRATRQVLGISMLFLPHRNGGLAATGAIRWVETRQQGRAHRKRDGNQQDARPDRHVDLPTKRATVDDLDQHPCHDDAERDG